MARNYSYHYNHDSKEMYHITCGRLAQVIRDRYREADQDGLGAARPEDDAGEPEDEFEDEFEAPAPVPVPAPVLALPQIPAGGAADLHDPVLWELVMRCQWALRSDRELSIRGVTALIDDLRADGCLNNLRRAFELLSIAVTKAHPSLAAISHPTLVQIIALGEDMTMAVGQAPDLLEYIKNEQQPVNLATLLRV
jgi:hypothetical protein